jgi:5-methylcytosine-specific restriction endonuclease McrA
MKKAKVFSANKTSNKTFTKKRMYDTVEWVEYRNIFLGINPRCYACGKSARVVDHWKAHKGSEELFWKVDNFIPLCKEDHDFVTGSFDRHNPPKTEEKLKWLADARLKNDISFKIKVVPRQLKMKISCDTD